MPIQVVREVDYSEGVPERGHPHSLGGLVLPKVIGHGWPPRDSPHPRTLLMQHERFNNPNWFQTVSVYCPGGLRPIEEFTIEQVWDGSTAGHRRLRNAAIETVEALRDITGLQYILWAPLMYGGVEIRSNDRQIVSVD